MADDFNGLAVLWDMDGVLVDSGDLHYQTFKVALEELGYTYTREDFKKTFGMNNRSLLYTIYGDDLDPSLYDQLIDRKESLFREKVPEHVVLLPAVRGWLAQLKNGGAMQAVASSAPCENIEVSVDALDIRQYFNALVSGADLPGKPNPDVYLKAAEEVGVPPEQCVVLEDAVHGVEGALAAGMKCIAVTTTQPAKVLKEADLVLKDLTELTTEKFLRLFE